MKYFLIVRLATLKEVLRREIICLHLRWNSLRYKFIWGETFPWFTSIWSESFSAAGFLNWVYILFAQSDLKISIGVFTVSCIITIECGTVGCVPAFQSEDPGSTLTPDHGMVLGKLFKNTAFPCPISSRTWGLALRCAYGYKPTPKGGFHYN